MADRPSGFTQPRVNSPMVYNHHQMLKEIRDSLKHLRREPESGNEQNESATSTYSNNPSAQNQRVHHQARFPTQRKNFVEASRGADQGVQANRNYDESGYSSSSSECSSLSANDLNGGQQYVGNMSSYYNEEALRQSLFSSSNFDFVRAMSHNDGYQRINPNMPQRREPPPPMPQMQFPAKSPPPYRVALQKNNYGAPPDHQPIATHLTSKVETSKFMQTTALPSGNTTISQAEWKVTTGPEMPTRGKSPVPYSRPVIPEGAALWKSRPYSVGPKQLNTSPSGNHGNYHLGPYAHPQPQQIAAPQFQVQVSLNAPSPAGANISPPNFSPVVSKGNGHSATFRVSVQANPVPMTTERDIQDSRGYPGLHSGMNGYQRHEPLMDYRSNPAVSQYEFHSPRTLSNHYIQRSNQCPPAYSLSSYKAPPPCDSSQSSFTSYQGSESDMKSCSPSQSAILQQWSHRNIPSVDGMSVSSEGSESHSSTIEDEFPDFDRASLASYDDLDDETPNVYTNKTGTLVVHVRNRPTWDAEHRGNEGSGSGSPVNGKSGQNRGQRLTSQAYKFYMEQRIENLLKDRKEREERRVQLEEEMRKVQLSEEAQSEMRKILNQKESNYIRLKRSKMDPSMFHKLQVIGVGAFGEVCLTRHVQSGSLYAMKILKKSEVLKRNQVAHVKAERDILAEADNEWVVKLFYSFQDKENLYFVMEYVPGGDLMSLLIKLGVFNEEMARFYIAELVLAIESVHKMGFIHRDIKPDNVLIDSDGHIKLTDFGLCTGFRWTHNSKYYESGTLTRNHSRCSSFDIDEGAWAKEHKCRCGNAVDGQKPLARRHIRQHMRCQAHSLVGTPNYIAPEVLMRIPYTHLCDWWSVGVILYEMLVGQPPFYAPNAAETQIKVINWETSLNIPRQAKLSSEAEDLILRLCTSDNQRLGNGGVDDIKNHPFFHGIDWLMIRRTKAYYIPQIRHPEDTSNFDPVEPDRPQSSECESMGEVSEDGAKSKHPTHAFYEFTFRRFFTKDQARSSVSNYSSWDGTESDENKAPVFV